MKKKLEKINTGSAIRIVEDTQRKLYIINVGKYGTKEELLPTSERLKEAGIDHFVKCRKEVDTLLSKGI